MTETPPPNKLVTAAQKILLFTHRLQKKGHVRQAGERIYGDLTNRLFSFGIDMVVLLIPITILTNILVLVFFGHYQYEATIEQIRHTVSPQTFAPLAQDAFAMNRFIAENYPADAAVILNQVIFVRTAQAVMLGIYIIFFNYKFGATPGKMVMGLKIVDKITGGKMTLSQTVIRFLGLVVAIPFGLLNGGLRKDKRTWHDFMADTVVVYTPERWYKTGFKNLINRIKKQPKS